MTKIRSITQLYSTLFINLIYECSKRFVQPVVQTVVQPVVQTVVQPVVQTVVQTVVQPVVQTVVQTVVQPAAKCKRTLKSLN